MKINHTYFNGRYKVGLVKLLAVVTMVAGCGKSDDARPENQKIGAVGDGAIHVKGNNQLPINPDFSPDAVEQYRVQADAGDCKAQYLYSLALSWGIGVQRDESAAFAYASKSATQNFELAYQRVGLAYHFGFGVSSNEVEAVEWYNKAVAWAKGTAKDGDVWAQWCLGVCYQNGVGVEKDAVEAVKWYRAAADQGYAVARRNIVQLKTFVFKDLYLGMNYSDAVEICEKKFGRKFSGVKNENGLVAGFELSRDDVDSMFNTQGVSGRKFCESLLSAYPILEKFEVRSEKVADVEAQEKYMREAQWRAAEGIMNGTIQNGGQAFAVGAAAGRRARRIADQMTKYIDCYYYESDKGFVLEIRPEQPERFFVLRNIASVNIENFD